jgi:NADH-quinone oxidoreductase subunit F
VFDDSACMVQAAYRYSRFLFVESCGQCPACKFGTGEVTQTLAAIEAGGGSDRDLELILVRARGSTGGQKCALPTGESLLLQSLVQVFGEEFGSHVGRECPLPRELPFHKLVDWDAAAGRFAYDLAMHTSSPTGPPFLIGPSPHRRVALRNVPAHGLTLGGRLLGCCPSARASRSW